MTEKVEVSVAVVIDQEKVLVQTRPEGADYAGFWEFPGGKQEPGELITDTVCRELREELAIEVAGQNDGCVVVLCVHPVPELLDLLALRGTIVLGARLD